MKKIKEMSLSMYVILNIICVLVGSYLYTKSKYKIYKQLSKVYIILLILNILVLLIMLIVKKKKKNLNVKLNDILLLLMIIFSGISAVFAINKKIAIYGISGRYEGLLQILYYFSIYLLSTYIEKKQKKIIIHAIILCGIIELVYAVFQVMNIGNVVTQYMHGNPWASGLTSNPNFFGTFTLLNLSYVLGLFMDEEKLYLKIIYGLLMFIFMIGLLMSDTMSCVVGLICVLLCVVVYTIRTKKYLKFVIILLILLLSTLLITRADKTALTRDFIKITNQTKEITKGNLDETYGSNRIYVWKNTLKAVPKHILTGVGIDNFYYAFGDKPLMMGKWFFDKAHNEYLQILITEGIFGLLSYLLFYGTIVIRGVKNSFKDKKIYLLLPVIGYLTQAFFNISVIEVAPFFYISLGLLVDRGINNEESKCNNTST